MKFKNLYEITFRFRRSGWHGKLIHIEAKNMKEAKQIAKDLWYDAYEPHMFNINIRRVPLDECIDMAHWFVDHRIQIVKQEESMTIKEIK